MNKEDDDQVANRLKSRSMLIEVFLNNSHCVNRNKQ